MSAPGAALIARATQRLREAAAEAQQERGLTSSSAVEDYNTRCFDDETARINSEIEQTRAGPSSVFFPALYLRARDPAGDETTRLLRSTCKAYELDLRFKEIEKLDEMHAKLWTLLSAGDRRSITLEQYEHLLRDFNTWAAAQYGAPLPPPPPAVWEVSSVEDEHEAPLAAAGLVSPLHGPSSVSPDRAELPLKSLSVPLLRSSLESDRDGRSATRSQSWGLVAHHVQQFREQRKEQQQQRSESLASAAATAPSQRTAAQFEQVLRLAEDQPTLGSVLFLYTVPPPRPDMELFLACPRNAERAVDIAAIYQTFAKQVSLVKCEAELIMWDSNTDGRLSEDEVESYVRDLVPRIAALSSMGSDLLPFYCCTVSRRLFWDLDPGNRGVLRIHSLLQSTVMNEWVSLQLMSEDDPQNWFGAAVTQQLYNKFVMLDTRNKGTLNVENLRQYKKGLPTVIDDGLPLDTSPLCSLFIDRYFETNTLMTRSEMDYRKFVDFVIAVELLPQCSRPHFFWNILDVDGTGVVTPMIANQFFRETHAKLVAAGLDVPSRETVVQEVFDLVEKAEPLRITRDEFVCSPQAGLFVGLLIDCLSFWTYENREQR